MLPSASHVEPLMELHSQKEYEQEYEECKSFHLSKCAVILCLRFGYTASRYARIKTYF